MARGDAKDLFFRELRTAGLSKPAAQAIVRRLDALEGTTSAGALSAFYGDESMGAGTAPTLALEPDRWTSDADGLVCEVDATVPNQVNILADGLYSLTAQVFLFNAGTTGGSVALRLVRGDNFLQFGDEVGADPGGPEVDCAMSVVLPLLAGDQLLLLTSSTGADNTGNIAQLLVCKIA